MSKMITAVQLAKEMKLPPKRVRAILRQSGMEHDGRWKFPSDQKTKLKEVIRSSRKRANVAKAKAPAKKAGAKRKPTVEAAATMH